MTPAQFAAIVACIVLAALAVFQALLAAGRPLGRFAWAGSMRCCPGTSGSAAWRRPCSTGCGDPRSERTWRSDAGRAVSGVATWVLAAYGTLGIVVNAISRSRPERYTMTPVAAVLAVCFWVVAVS